MYLTIAKEERFFFFLHSYSCDLRFRWLEFSTHALGWLGSEGYHVSAPGARAIIHLSTHT